MLNKYLAVVFIAICLNGCSTSVERIRAELFEDMSSAVQIIVSDKLDEFEDLLKLAELCGFKGLFLSATPSGSRYKYQFTSHFRTRDELESTVSCSILSLFKPSVAANVEESIFGKTYSLKLDFGLATLLNKSDLRDGILIRMPGEISTVKDDSPKSRFSVSFVMPNKKGVLFKFVENKKSEIFSSGYSTSIGCSKDQTQCEHESTQESIDIELSRIILRVESFESNVDLQTLLAIAGLFLGSGLLIGAARIFRAKRRSG